MHWSKVPLDMTRYNIRENISRSWFTWNKLKAQKNFNKWYTFGYCIEIANYDIEHNIVYTHWWSRNCKNRKTKYDTSDLHHTINRMTFYNRVRKWRTINDAKSIPLRGKKKDTVCL
jgi:hypothetical protein